MPWLNNRNLIVSNTLQRIAENNYDCTEKQLHSLGRKCTDVFSRIGIFFRFGFNKNARKSVYINIGKERLQAYAQKYLTDKTLHTETLIKAIPDIKNREYIACAKKLHLLYTTAENKIGPSDKGTLIEQIITKTQEMTNWDKDVCFEKANDIIATYQGPVSNIEVSLLAKKMVITYLIKEQLNPLGNTLDKSIWNQFLVDVQTYFEKIDSDQLKVFIEGIARNINSIEKCDPHTTLLSLTTKTTLQERHNLNKTLITLTQQEKIQKNREDEYLLQQQRHAKKIEDITSKIKEYDTDIELINETQKKLKSALEQAQNTNTSTLGILEKQKKLFSIYREIGSSAWRLDTFTNETSTKITEQQEKILENTQKRENLLQEKLTSSTSLKDENTLHEQYQHIQKEIKEVSQKLTKINIDLEEKQTQINKLSDEEAKSKLQQLVLRNCLENFQYDAHTDLVSIQNIDDISPKESLEEIRAHGAKELDDVIWMKLQMHLARLDKKLPDDRVYILNLIQNLLTIHTYTEEELAIYPLLLKREVLTTSSTRQQQYMIREKNTHNLQPEQLRDFVMEECIIRCVSDTYDFSKEWYTTSQELVKLHIALLQNPLANIDIMVSLLISTIKNRKEQEKIGNALTSDTFHKTASKYLGGNKLFSSFTEVLISAIATQQPLKKNMLAQQLQDGLKTATHQMKEYLHILVTDTKSSEEKITYLATSPCSRLTHLLFSPLIAACKTITNTSSEEKNKEIDKQIQILEKSNRKLARISKIPSSSFLRHLIPSSMIPKGTTSEEIGAGLQLHGMLLDKKYYSMQIELQKTYIELLENTKKGETNTIETQIKHIAQLCEKQISFFEELVNKCNLEDAIKCIIDKK